MGRSIDDRLFLAAIEAYYKHSPAAETKIGTMITSQILQTHRPILATLGCQRLMREYHGFAVDVALGLALSIFIDTKPLTCKLCEATNHLGCELLLEGRQEFFCNVGENLQTFWNI